jgi:hypothetical protein
MPSPSGPALPPLLLPAEFNYIAVFLTLACNLRCSFCINHYGAAATRYAPMCGADWLRGLNRLVPRADLPVTLQGGEPSLHPDFLQLINGLTPTQPLDLLTNLQFDIDAFMRAVPPERLRRAAPYASIRVSYHPETMRLAELKPKVLRLLERGYSVGIWAVQHPAQIDEIERAADDCRRAGIDFRCKEFLGVHAGRLHGAYKYPAGLSGMPQPPVQCRTTELIIGPSGHVFRCHGDLYEGRAPVGHVCDPALALTHAFRPCTAFGHCNPCDVKIKTNRFQQFGHTSVEIIQDGRA